MSLMTKTAPPLDAKPQRSTTPASLLSQWWTLGTITADRRTTGRHAKVAWVIIDRYRQDFGNGRASVRYIARACDLSASIVSKACRELVEWGYFSQNVGIGTRPTEFTPNWATVPPVSNTKADNISVPQGSNTCVPQGSNANDDSVLPVSHESYLPYPADKAGLRVSRNEFEAAPVAPLADGLVAAAADPASGGFGEFWSIWPRKHGKPAARIAFGKVDAGLHDTILAAARSWSEHYAKHGVEKRWIPEPANWLAKERWDEDLPIIHDDAKGAAIAKAKANANAPANSVTTPTPSTHNGVSTAAFMIGSINPFSQFGTFSAQIVSSKVWQEQPGEELLTVDINWSGPLGDVWQADTWHEFLVYSERNAPAREKGKRMLDAIVAAVGLDSIDDSDDLHHRPFLCTIHEDLTITYAPAPANDNLEYAA